MLEDSPVRQDLTIIVPVYNEEKSLYHFLPELLQTCQKKNWQVIFVNDGSTDNSAKILAEYADDPLIKVLHHKVNRGYGSALKTGLSSAKTCYAVTIDGDGQHQISDIEAIFNLAIKSDADLLIGSRAKMEHVNIYRELGKWLIRSFTRILVPQTVKDLNSGFKLYRTELVHQYLHVCPDSMAFSEVITLLFINQGHLVLEIPVSVKKRIAGSSSINTQTAFQTLIEILGLVMLINPLRIFLPLSFICVAAGLLWGVPIILAGRGVSVGSMLAIVLGTFFFFLGLIANQLSAIRLHLAGMRKNENSK
jgi:hypothetical protein